MALFLALPGFTALAVLAQDANVVFERQILIEPPIPLVRPRHVATVYRHENPKVSITYQADYIWEPNPSAVNEYGLSTGGMAATQLYRLPHEIRIDVGGQAILTLKARMMKELTFPETKKTIKIDDRAYEVTISPVRVELVTARNNSGQAEQILPRVLARVTLRRL